ncbi:MAG: site-2 protease family protein [Gemmatimonas sp.]|nr:site-2 protease family protein [Gemmatimonas sp.]
MSLFAVYRTVVIRDDEIVQGVLHPELGPDHPVVRAALERWEGTHFVYPTEDGTEVTLVRPVAERPRERWWIHYLLGLTTFVTTTAAGAYFAGRQPFVLAFLPGPLAIPYPVGLAPADFLPGLSFSVPLLVVLLGHELGHYLVARRHGMNVSPPFFIPAPHWINLIGTFGAFIRLRSAVVNRIVLLDVGAAGPLVSFGLSVPVAAVGLALTRPLPPLVDGEAARYAIRFGNQLIWLGDSILFGFLDRVFAGEGGFLLLHPLAFAGWIGLFVTALNLFPLAQLDGGHILYALLGHRQRYLGAAFLAALLALGFFWWGWWLWAALILFLGKGRVRHPSVFDPEVPVVGVRRLWGWACVAIFILTFVAIPMRL